MEYFLRQLNDYDFTLGLEERVTSLKARIKAMKIKIGEIDPNGRKEPKLDIPKQVVEQPKSSAELLKEKLLSRSNKDFYKPVD